MTDETVHAVIVLEFEALDPEHLQATLSLISREVPTRSLQARMHVAIQDTADKVMQVLTGEPHGS